MGHRVLLASILLLVLPASARSQEATPPAPPRAKPTTEDSKPSDSGGHMVFETFPSAAMGGEQAYGVYLPPGYETEQVAYPVIYFLHGLFENEQRFNFRGGRDVVDKLIAAGTIGKVIVAIPRGELSFYTNDKEGKRRWEDMVITDFVDFIEKKYRVKPGVANRALSGVSMGGFGSIKIGFRHPGRFGSLSAHSAALLEPDVDKLPAYTQRFLSFPPVKKAVAQIFGDPIDEKVWKENNPFYLAETRTDIGGVKLYFDCGDHDKYGFQNGAKAFHELLERKKIAHKYEELPGDHGWEYLQQQLHRSIEFHWRQFGEKTDADSHQK